MKKMFVGLLAIAAFLVTSCTNAPKSDEAKTTEAKEVTTEKTGESWKVNASDSKIEWIGTKVTGYHTGEVPVKSGELFVKGGDVTGGRFIMDVANMTVSGPKGSDSASNTKLLGHLKSSDFFDVQKHPEAVFELIDIKPFTGTVKDTTDPRQDEISEYKVSDPTHTVNGNLTIKGVTKNIEFPARITVNGGAAQALAKFNIDRSEWGITYPGKQDDLIRNAIHLGIRIKASK
jgi:hypothetical protein